MGKKAQRRRKMQANSATLVRPRTIENQFAHAARRSCDDCGSTMIEWGTLGAAVAAGWGGAGAAEGLRDAAAAFGPETEAWRCRNCDNFGFFSPAIWG